MRLRLSLLSLLPALVGCATADLPPEADAFVELTGPQLEVDSQTSASVLPNQSVALEVRYRDASGRPAAGVQVEFALTGVAPGASLAPWRAVTDSEGLAGTQLLVGSMPGSVEVRAGTHTTGAVYMRVQVREALATQVVVRVAYEGTRDVDAYTVTALPDMRCDDALEAGVAGAVVHRFTDDAQQVDFALMPAADTALVAWARDESGGQLARGCVEFSAPVSAAPEAPRTQLVIALADTPLRLEGSLPIMLQLDLAASMKRLRELSDSVVQQALDAHPQHAEAAFYLSYLAQRLGVDPATLAPRQASLATRLRAGEVGPRALATHFGELLSKRGAGAQLRLRSALGGDVELEALEALAADDGATLGLPLRPELGLSATLDANAARLTIAELRLALGLGAYAKALLAGLEAEAPAGFAAGLARAAGCEEVVGPWAQQEALADAMTGTEACLAAVHDLQARFGAALDALSAQPVVLAGSLPARDRSEDGAVDDLGPGTLEGSWLGDDRVAGDVRVPTQKVLVL